MSTEASLNLGDIIAAEERMLTRLEPSNNKDKENKEKETKSASSSSNSSMLLETKGIASSGSKPDSKTDSSKPPSTSPLPPGGTGGGGKHPWLVSASAVVAAAAAASATSSSSSSSSSSVVDHIPSPSPLPLPPPTTTSVNEKMLRSGLARVSRTATRLLPRQGPLAGSTGKQRGYARPPATLSPLATTLYEQILEAELAARRAHLNLYRCAALIVLYAHLRDTHTHRSFCF